MRKTVLVVDDFEDNRQMYAEFLSFSGFTVVEAAAGLEAVERATADPPDVVVMDLSLPVLDGWEATRRLKGDPRTTHVPVIALTGHAIQPEAPERRAAAHDAYLAKPCLPETLVATIEGVLRRSAG